MRVVQRAAACLLAVLVVGLGITPVDALPRPECGGYDTTPAAPHVLGNGTWCNGQVNSCDDQTDYFRISLAAGQKAKVSVPWMDRGWSYIEGPGRSYTAFNFDIGIVAPSDPGPHLYTLYILYDHPTRYDEAPGDWDPCDDGEDIQSYSVRYDIVTNTPPAVTMTAPSFVVYKDRYDIVRTVTDAQGNGDCVWLSVDPADTAYRCRFGSSWTLSSPTTAYQTWTWGLRADDIFEESSSTTHQVVVGQDDCGTGGDIEIRPMVQPPVNCRATLWNGVDDVDTFWFLAIGGAGRVRFSVVLESGWSPIGDVSLRLSDSGGLLWSGGAAGGTVPVVPGNAYTLGVTRLVSDGSYAVSIEFLPPPAAPLLDVVWPAYVDVHQGEEVTLRATATDPNGYDVALDVDWGDGGTSRSPIDGLAPSGHTKTFTHHMGAVATANVVVTATNVEGLTTSGATWITVEPEHDCGIGPVGSDAPRRSGSGHARLVPSFICEGHLGYWVESGQSDFSDAYSVPGDGTAYTIHAEAPGSSVRVSLWLFGVVPLRGTVGAVSTLDVLALPPGDHIVEVERVAGQGPYVLAMY